MTRDLRSGLHALHDDELRSGDELPVSALVARARRRRALTRTAYGAFSTAAVAGLVVGGLALVDRPAPIPPAVTTPAPDPTVAPSPTEPAPAPSGVAWTPNLSRCAMPGDGWVAAANAPDQQVWVGNYWGADQVASSDAWLTRSDAIWGEDHGGAVMTVEVLDAVVIPMQGWTGEGVQVVGGVAAVLGEQVPPFDVTLGSGSEGGGGGSSAGIETPLPLALCGDAPTLEDGEYLTVTRYRLGVAGQTSVVFGVSYQRIGEAATPDAGGTTAPFEPAWDPDEVLLCDAVPDHLHTAATQDAGGLAAVLPSGFSRDPDNTRLDTTIDYGPLGGLPADGRFMVVAMGVAQFQPGPDLLDGHAVRGTLGPLVAVADSGSLRSAWSAPVDGQLDIGLPVVRCGTEAGPLPTGLYVVHVKVAAQIGDLTDTFWAEQLVAVGDVALP